MMRTMLVALVCLVASPALASAQELHAGVPLDALRSALGEVTLEAREPVVPESPSMPVRVPLARDQRVAVLLDVVVLASAAEARAWADDHVRTASTAGLVAREGRWADVPEGAASLVIAARGNVAYALRSVDDVDAWRVADVIDEVIAHAPEGAPRAAAIAAPQVEVAPGGVVPVPVPAELVASTVSVTGAAYAQRTCHGWVLHRTGPGTFTVAIVGVDRLLRVVR